MSLLLHAEQARETVDGDLYRYRHANAILHDTRCCFNVQSKADTSQLNLPHGTNN